MKVLFTATVDEGGVKFNFMQNAKQRDLGTANDSEEWWYISFLPHNCETLNFFFHIQYLLLLTASERICSTYCAAICLFDVHKIHHCKLIYSK